MERLADHKTERDGDEDWTAPNPRHVRKDKVRRRKSSEETALIAVDKFPNLKERSKTLSRLTTHLVMLLLDQKWPTFEHYTRFLARKYPGDLDVSMLCDIYRVDHLRNIRDSGKAAAMFPAMDRSLNQIKCPSLSVRYLTSKAITLYFAGEQTEALSLQHQAIQMGKTQAPSNSTAFNLTVYALHGCLHRVDDRGNNVIPSEHDWRSSESYYKMACEHHLAWTRDLEDATKIPGKVCRSFFLYSFVRYIFALVRSCVAGGFIYFERHQCPPCNIEKASKCIERVKKEDEVLSTRIKLEFALVQCDYFLRKAQFSDEHKDSRNMYIRSQHLALEAFRIATKIPDVNHATSCGSYATIRLHYIETKLKSSALGEAHGHETGTSTMDISRLSFISHKSPFVGLTHRPSEVHIGEDLTVQPAENLIETHQAACPECAIVQTSPKEAFALNLNLSEHRSSQHENRSRPHGYLDRQCPHIELSPRRDRQCVYLPVELGFSGSPEQASMPGGGWLGKHDNVHEERLKENRDLVDMIQSTKLARSDEDTSVNLISTPLGEEIGILKRE